MAIPSKKPSGSERKGKERKTVPEEWLFRIIDCEEVRHDVLFPASDFAVEIYLTVPGA